MKPFIVRYAETEEQFIVLNQIEVRGKTWWTLANTTSKEFRGTQSLKGYEFIGFPK